MSFRLYDPALVKQLKRAVRSRVKQRGKKSAQRKWWKTMGPRSARLWWLYLVASLVRAGVLNKSKTPTWEVDLLCSLSLAVAGLALGQARKLHTKLTDGDERKVLLFYPIGDGQFFDWQTTRFVVSTIWVIPMTAVFYFFAVSGTGAAAWVTRATAPLAEWLILLCAVLALFRHVEKYPPWLSLAFYAAAALLFLVPTEYSATMRPLAYVLPTGWFHPLLTNNALGDWLPWAVGMLVPSFTGLAWWLRLRLKNSYRPEMDAQGTRLSSFRTPELLSPVDLQQIAPPASESEENPAEDLTEEAALPIHAVWQKQRLENWSKQVADHLTEVEWMEGWDWKHLGPIEWATSWLLTDRERGEAQFLLGPSPPKWSARWRVAIIATAAAFALVLPGLRELNVLAALAFAVSIGAGLPILGGVWPATNQGRISGKFVPIFACFPLSYWNAGRTIYKVNVVRTAAWIPLAGMLGALGARTAQKPIIEGCEIMLRALLLFLAVIPVMIAGKFSKITNDTMDFRLATIPLLGVASVLILIVVGLGAAAMYMSSGWAYAFIGLEAVAGWTIWLLYGVYYERGRVDLLREKQ